MPDNGWFGGDETTDLCILEEEEKEALPCHLHQAVNHRGLDVAAWGWW